MASRRMFALPVIDSDRFAEMPLSTQALYFHLGMRGDDDGFVSNPRQIQRMIGATDDDLKLLIAKGFIIAFNSGIVVITHWKVHNYIQKDRYKPTGFLDEKAQLIGGRDVPYALAESIPEDSDTECVQNVSSLDTKPLHRLGKDRLGKDSIVIGGAGGGENRDEDHPETPEGDNGALLKAKTRSRFAPPAQQEVQECMTEYARSKGWNINAADQAEAFMLHYQSNGWMTGKTHMKDWRSAAQGWLRRNTQGYSQRTVPQQQKQIPQSAYISPDQLYV